MNKVRCMLISFGLAKGLLTEDVCTKAYLINRSLYSSVKFKTPQHLWIGKFINLSHIRVFGCGAYANQIEGKLDPRATKCVMLRYSEGLKGYRLWVSSVQGTKNINSKNVVFNKSEMLRSKEKSHEKTDSITSQGGVKLTKFSLSKPKNNETDN